MEELSNDLFDEVEATYAPSSDTDKPIINVHQKTYVIKVHDSLDFLNDVTATDATEGNITNKITANTTLIIILK